MPSITTSRVSVYTDFGRARLEFQDAGQLALVDLSAYLHLLTVAYSCAESHARLRTVPDILNDPQIFSKYASGIASPSKGSEDATMRFVSGLYVERITYQSPLEIVVACCVPALVLALILSGGEIRYDAVKGVSAKLPPIGEGLRKLLDAIQKKPDAIRRRGKDKRGPRG